MNFRGFCDLNIHIPPKQLKKSCIEEIIAFGYKTVAINTVVGEESSEHSKKKKGQAKEIVSAPQQMSGVTEEFCGKIQILQRLTISFSDSNQLQRLSKSDNAKKYNIIAVIPKSNNALQLACACKDIDLISFDASDKPLYMNRKSYNLAVANNIYFEVPYAPAIADSGKRKHVIQTAHGYHTYGKSKNVVITSGAMDISKVRGPYDVANLGLLFGLSEEQAKYSMLNTSRNLILRAEGRKFGRTAMTMMITDLDIESEEGSDDEPVAKKSKKDNIDTGMFLDS